MKIRLLRLLEFVAGSVLAFVAAFLAAIGCALFESGYLLAGVLVLVLSAAAATMAIAALTDGARRTL